MNAYTISKLAGDAEVSIDIVRNYEQKGMLHSCSCTPSGYHIYNSESLDRLRFILAGKQAGLSLPELTLLCKALDSVDESEAQHRLRSIEHHLEQKLKSIFDFKRYLHGLRTEIASNI